MFTPNKENHAQRAHPVSSLSIQSHAADEIIEVVASCMARLTEPEALAAESVDSRRLQPSGNKTSKSDNTLVKRRFLRQNRDLIR